MTKTSEVHVPYIPPENIKLITKPWPYAKNTVYLNVANRNWRVEGHHFYCPVHVGGQVKSLLSQSLDKVLGKGDELPMILALNRWQWAHKGLGACKRLSIVQGRLY